MNTDIRQLPGTLLALLLCSCVALGCSKQIKDYDGDVPIPDIPLAGGGGGPDEEPDGVTPPADDLEAPANPNAPAASGQARTKPAPKAAPPATPPGTKAAEID